MEISRDIYVMEKKKTIFFGGGSLTPQKATDYVK
jgi:hypothetical protein